MCSLKVLQEFACSTRSSWFLFLHICLIFNSCSSCCLGVTRSSSIFLIIYLGCEEILLFSLVASYFEQLKFSSGFISILCWSCRGIEGFPFLQGWGVSVHCSDPGCVALTLFRVVVHVKTSLLIESLVLCFSECNYHLDAFNILASLLLSSVQ